MKVKLQNHMSHSFLFFLPQNSWFLYLNSKTVIQFRHQKKHKVRPINCRYTLWICTFNFHLSFLRKDNTSMGLLTMENKLKGLLKVHTVVEKFTNAVDICLALPRTSFRYCSYLLKTGTGKNNKERLYVSDYLK